MGENTKIGWCDQSFNPWTGCQKVGPGCDHCYAESWAKRSGVVQWGPDAQRRRTSLATWAQPLKWNGRHKLFEAEHGRRQRVFCASLADVFDNRVPPEWRADLFDLIKHTPHLDWLLLTKRIANAADMMFEARVEKLRLGELLMPLPNVWIGSTIVNREEMLRDGPKLAKVPAAVRFWSCEPLLEDLGRVPASMLPDWIIAGGESGAHCRPCNVEWLESLRDEAIAGGVPLFVKQLGGHPNKRDGLEDLPESLRVRQWPDVEAERASAQQE